MTPALLSDLDESIACHILNTFVRLVHEFKELVDHSFEELPVCFEEAWILSDNVHDIGRDDGLVVFAALNFAKTKQVLDDGDQESLLGVLI